MSLDATDMGLAHDAAALDLGRVGDVRPVRWLPGEFRPRTPL